MIASNVESYVIDKMASLAGGAAEAEVMNCLVAG
jgi:hypothetical protein